MSEPALQADGFESAVLGVVCMPCSSQHVIVYDRKACIEVLTSRDGMSLEEAEEFFEFNVAGAYCGPGTPVFLIRPEPGQTLGDFVADLEA